LFPANELSMTGNLVSTALIIIGSGLSVYIVFWLGRSFSLMPEARRLVTAGPYGFIRHPLYVAEEISLIGIYMLYASVGTTAL
jgi:protein-S-isoprenylcysteine O-methyltransferase Ste14